MTVSYYAVWASIGRYSGSALASDFATSAIPSSVCYWANRWWGNIQDGCYCAWHEASCRHNRSYEQSACWESCRLPQEQWWSSSAPTTYWLTKHVRWWLQHNAITISRFLLSSCMLKSSFLWLSSKEAALYFLDYQQLCNEQQSACSASLNEIWTVCQRAYHIYNRMSLQNNTVHKCVDVIVTIWTAKTILHCCDFLHIILLLNFSLKAESHRDALLIDDDQYIRCLDYQVCSNIVLLDLQC